MKFKFFLWVGVMLNAYCLVAAPTLETGRVRIGLKLTPYELVTVQNKTGAIQQKYLPKSVLKHTLRAKLDRPNHFYVDGFHFQTTPLSWVSQTKRYKVRVDMMTSSQKAQVEEPVGSIVLQGVLKPAGKKGLWVLDGVATARLKDKVGHPLADVQLGHQSQEPSKVWAEKRKSRKRDSSL
ncbi:MAG: hypothetical protein AB8C84_11055 [Oligoflexales bacterium]